MSEKEKEMREMVETLRKLPDHAQEKIGYMIEGAALVSGAHEDESKKDGAAARDGAGLRAAGKGNAR